MAGLVPAIHARRSEWHVSGIEPFVWIGPIRIEVENEADLPGARSMLHVALGLKRAAGVGESFIADESIEPVASPVRCCRILCESLLVTPTQNVPLGWLVTI